ncbi:MAG: hypothetical protein F4Y27_04920 [Acidimicrobiaceae bacterium]|nr:hypothetical protein [Acidimicrobiaceae bacterium]MYG55880.1 hypothetical protein [Acidimicrobiaceae bacterium]MYJ99517.1 hypothetical protein [Acidimicrobiaceae bacterium]
MIATLSRCVWKKARWALLLLAAPLLFVACADDDEEAPIGLSRADVEGIVEDDIEAAMAGIPEPEPGLSRADVAAIVEEALAAMPEPEPALTVAQIEQIARSVAITVPPKADESAYTQFFVDNAIDMYEADGRDNTLEYYNSLESVDGQWYMFIIDSDDTVIGHYDNERLGRDANDPIYSDINGYFYGPELLSATEEGKWVGYAFQNPGTGDINTGDYGEYELKNTWVVRHDGLVFGSGWYINADDMTIAYVQAAVDAYITGGLQGVVESLSHPDSVYTGAAGALEYYNNVDHIDGEFFAFTSGPDGTILLHSDTTKVGTHTDEVFGGAEFSFSGVGNWQSTEGVDAQTGNTVTTRVWGINYNGLDIVAGWRNDGTR